MRARTLFRRETFRFLKGRLEASIRMGIAEDTAENAETRNGTGRLTEGKEETACPIYSELRQTSSRPVSAQF